MKRQSAVLINSAMSDERLAEALLRIEELTKSVDEQQEMLKSRVGAERERQTDRQRERVCVCVCVREGKR